MTIGRKLQIGPTDRTSEQRTPIASLRPIPDAARRSFVPYYDALPGLRAGENDLTRLAPGRPRAAGTVMTLTGTLRDAHGRPLRDTLVEIWQANAEGRYAHTDDPARAPLDPYFSGVGRTISDAEGRYTFLTIVPAAYLARPDIGRWRPAHVHFSLLGGGSRLITQMYFPGDPHLSRDPCFHLLGTAGDRHLGRPVEGGMVFDIVVGGRSTSWFEDEA